MADSPTTAVSNPPSENFVNNLSAADMIRRSATSDLPVPERQLTPVAKLIENRGGGQLKGEPNAWALTERGQAIHMVISERGTSA